jgi:hypothetical protein
MRDELRFVVLADITRYIVFGNDPVKNTDDPLCIYGPIYWIGEVLLLVLINDV